MSVEYGLKVFEEIPMTSKITCYLDESTKILYLMPKLGSEFTTDSTGALKINGEIGGGASKADLDYLSSRIDENTDNIQTNAADIQTLFGYHSTISYALTLKANNNSYGDVAGSGTFEEGSSIKIAAVPKTGYTFTNWSDGTTTYNSQVYSVSMNGNKSLTANFSEIAQETVKITFNGNGGNVTGGGEIHIEVGSKITNLGSYTAYIENCTFAGWYKSSSSRTEKVDSNTTFSTDTELFAHYNVKITFDSGDGTITIPSGKSNPLTIARGSSTDINSWSAKNGNVDLDHWKDSSNNTITNSTIFNKDTTIYAVYKTCYTLEFYSDNRLTSRLASYNIPLNTTMEDNSVDFPPDSVNHNSFLGFYYKNGNDEYKIYRNDPITCNLTCYEISSGNIAMISYIKTSGGERLNEVTDTTRNEIYNDGHTAITLTADNIIRYVKIRPYNTWETKTGGSGIVKWRLNNRYDGEDVEPGHILSAPISYNGEILVYGIPNTFYTINLHNENGSIYKSYSIPLGNSMKNYNLSLPELAKSSDTFAGWYYTDSSSRTIKFYKEDEITGNIDCYPKYITTGTNSGIWYSSSSLTILNSGSWENDYYAITGTYSRIRPYNQFDPYVTGKWSSSAGESLLEHTTYTPNNLFKITSSVTYIYGNVRW